MVSIPVVFLGSFEPEFLSRDEVMKVLKDAYPNVEFKPYNVNSVSDALTLLKSEADASGFLIFNARVMPQGVVRVILKSGKPILYIAKSMEGSPNFLIDVADAVREGYPILSVVTEDVLSRGVVDEVKYLIALDKIRGSKVLLVTARNLISYMNWAFPNATEVSRAVAELQRRFGVSFIFMDLKEFIDKYYNVVDSRDAEDWAERWIKAASQFIDPSRADVVKAARLYLAMKAALRDTGANVMAFDCIMNVSTGIIDAWPCLGYMQLWYEDIIPVCEADVYSIIPLLIGKYLFNRPGFVNDPGVDVVNGRFIYWHCYAPTNPHGSDKPEAPYIITDAHGGSKHASIHVKLPVNEPVTVMGFNPITGILSIHTAKAVDNIYWKQLCATKLVASGDAGKVAERWVVDNGYHRVLIYGDFRREVKEFAKLLGVKVIEED
ncbi:fucose isomerase [Caldivirga sp. UBA161]|uniref:fucose isomerase n=1 Tax=Caldivirga sp. UBA161 TaxID=1915569 RepID=UPI0025BDEA53|nr:fucose isomerase [Caldivirga sp. UBA161]